MLVKSRFLLATGKSRCLVNLEFNFAGSLDNSCKFNSSGWNQYFSGSCLSCSEELPILMKEHVDSEPPLVKFWLLLMKSSQCLVDQGPSRNFCWWNRHVSITIFADEIPIIFFQLVGQILIWHEFLWQSASHFRPCLCHPNSVEEHRQQRSRGLRSGVCVRI